MQGERAILNSRVPGHEKYSALFGAPWYFQCVFVGWGRATVQVACSHWRTGSCYYELPQIVDGLCHAKGRI